MPAATMLPTGPKVFPASRTVLQVITAARWLCWAWMTGVILFSGDAVRHPALGWIVVVGMLVSTAEATLSARRAPERLVAGWRVAADGAAAFSLTMLDGYLFAPGHVFETSQNVAVEWTLIAVATAGIAVGPVIAGAIGLTFGPARLLGARLNQFHYFHPRHFVSIVATGLFYGACGVVFGIMTRMLRRAEAEVSHARARDEVARVMHDTVLQTLALVDRRSRDRDPELAAMARQADRDVRQYLFGARPTAGLGAAINAAVATVRGGADLDITVNVIDDGCRLSALAIDAVARAVGQAVANAIEHADASRIVVFAETDDVGQVFASVRDDGTGFDVSAPRHGHGFDESIVGRVEAIGGRVEATSGANGTEIRIWSAA